MPLIIFLKEPKIQVFANANEVEDKHLGGDTIWKCYLQHETGESMWIPANNIAMIQVISEEEIKKMKKESEERRKKMEERGAGITTARIVGPAPGGFTRPGGGRRH